MPFAFDLTDLVRLLEPLLLASLRVLTALRVSPLFPPTLFPAMLRNVVALSWSLAVYPHVAAHMPTLSMAPAAWLSLIAIEVFVGALIGLSVAVLVQAFESVGAIVDVQTGLSNATLYDPFGGHADGPMSTLLVRLAVAFFVAAGGLTVLASLLFASFEAWPVGAWHPQIDVRLADFATMRTSELAGLIARVATPIVLVLLVIDLGFGLVNRVVPQLNVFFFTMPIKGIVAALMVAVFLSFTAELVADRVRAMGSWVERVVPVLGPR